MEESFEHIGLQIKAVPLTHLTNAELCALRAYTQRASKDARKASNKVVMKEVGLKSLLLKALSFKSDDPARLVAQEAFESELARFPEALTRYSVANAYVMLEGNIREEVLRRASTTPPAKRRSV